jgi:hypothetical protein
MGILDFLLLAVGVWALIQIECRLEDIRSALDYIGEDVKEPE